LGKPLIHTSGGSIVADKAMGEPSDRIFQEDTSFVPETERVARVAIDRLVLNAPGIRSIVLCNSMTYGTLLECLRKSVQIPALAQQAKASGVAHYIGRGLNRSSNVHIADVASLYVLAIAKSPAGSFMYVEKAIAKRLDLGAAQPWPAEAAVAAWAKEKATFSFGSNSRVRVVSAQRSWVETEVSIDHGVDRARNGIGVY
jgi:nucleoside-diphosphate-sugar epimerase